MTLDLSKTLAHVDPLVGSAFGAYTIVARTGAGRFGSLYRAEDASHAPVTIQVLRTELVGNDAEVSAVTALKNPGIVRVLSSGVLPDGRHVRVLEYFDGQSLQDALDLKRTFTPTETIEVLSKLLQVLQTTHTWHVTHGRLGLTSVLRVGAQLKLLDFGFAKSAAKPADDLKAVGAIGFALLTGQEPEDGAPTLSEAVPERLRWLLRELFEGRIDTAAAARRELDWLEPSARRRRPLKVVLLALAVVLLGVGGWASTQLLNAPEPPPPPVQPPPEIAATPALEPDAGAPEDAGSAEPVELARVDEPPVSDPRKKKQRTVQGKAAPTAAALEKQIRAFEGKLRQQKRLKPDEVEEALHVLNKQRLRLTGDVTEDDRRDIATRLAAWKHIWLR